LSNTGVIDCGIARSGGLAKYHRGMPVGEIEMNELCRELYGDCAVMVFFMSRLCVGTLQVLLHGDTITACGETGY
jgi:hypothetical protein